MNKGLGIALKVLLAVVMIFCAFIIGWYVYILKFAPKQEAEYTHEPGQIETVDGTKKWFVELNYFSNENKNGLEMFEIKFNYLMDETRTSIISQGFQYVADSETDKIEWQYVVDGARDPENLGDVWYKGGWYDSEFYYGNWGYFDVDNAERFVYSSGDDYNHTTSAENPINQESSFKITLGSGEDLKVYKASFIQDGYSRTSENWMAFDPHTSYSFWVFGGGWQNQAYYTYYDVNYFAKSLFEQISTLEAGTDCGIEFPFTTDIFKYSKCIDEQAGRYEEEYVQSDLLTQNFKSYYGIHVKISANGARRASDSLFNCVKGNSAFNLTGDFGSEDYFYGEDIIKCDIYDFDYVNVDGNSYSLKLKYEFLNYYLQFRNDIKLVVEIDLDKLSEKNIQFFGFTKDSGLDNFEIYKCYTKQGGQTQDVEVTG